MRYLVRGMRIRSLPGWRARILAAWRCLRGDEYPWGHPFVMTKVDHESGTITVSEKPYSRPWGSGVD